jgi:hypothetical protein
MLSLVEKIFFRPKTLYSLLYLLSVFSSYEEQLPAEYHNLNLGVTE